MGKAAEALDNLLVLLRMFHERRGARVVRQGAGRFDRALLMFEILAVLKRQIEKCARDRRALPAQSPPHAELAASQGRIAAASSAPEHVSQIGEEDVKTNRQQRADVVLS